MSEKKYYSTKKNTQIKQVGLQNLLIYKKRQINKKKYIINLVYNQ